MPFLLRNNLHFTSSVLLLLQHQLPNVSSFKWNQFALKRNSSRKQMYQKAISNCNIPTFFSAANWNSAKSTQNWTEPVVNGMNRITSVSIVSDYGLNDSGSIPSRGPPRLLSNGYRGFFPRHIAWPGRDADHSPPSSAEVKKD
jgi:hypothetical protein